jgi:hypothetical protein
MKAYFKLRYKLLNRNLVSLGFTPVVAYILLPLVFVGVSFFLFYRADFLAQYIYAFLCLLILVQLNEIKRNDFLKICFGKNYKKIRMAENMLLTIPFLVILLIYSYYLTASVLFILSVILALIHFKARFQITVPTPFYKKPFEFTVGFRNTFLLFPFIYYVALMAIVHDNFNLGIIILIILFFIVLTYYLTSEPEYYVWLYSLNPKSFLWKKIKTAFLLSTCLALPIVLGLSVFFVSKIGFLLLFLLLGYAYLIMTIYFKYSIFPRQMNLPELFLVAAYLVFPFIMLPLIPHFYMRSKKKLENYLQ